MKSRSASHFEAEAVAGVAVTSWIVGAQKCCSLAVQVCVQIRR